MKKILLKGLAASFVGLALIQLVPYGRAHTNPPVTGEPPWDSARTRELAERACFDCHSNETRWPWYSHVAPISWLVQRDVDEGREHMDFSTWDRSHGHAREAAEEVSSGEMPLWFYLPLHPAARLTAAETDELVRGLKATFGGERRSDAVAKGDDEDADG